MIEFAKTSINKHGQLVADNFDDVYFSPKDGYEETKYVFLKGNNLPDKWNEQKSFTIIETGFGTGLNFLCTWKLWEKSATPIQNLHFISVEKYPLTLKTFEHSLNAYPQLNELKSTLNKLYPSLIKGTKNTIKITNNITLTLLIGDAVESLKNLDNKADAWFLDGFSPKKNPKMWNEKLYSTMARLSKPHTTFATFTAASHVRHGLERVGFNVERIKGFAYKKHMCRGNFKI